MKSPIWKSVEELENRDGMLYFEGCSAVELVNRFGSPLYVYSESRIRSNYRRLFRAYTRLYDQFEIYYAIKANNNPAIVRILASEGAGADASCVHEILIGLKAGISPEKLLYTGTFPDEEELAYALDNHIRLNIENLNQLDLIEKRGAPSFLSFRLNPGIGGSGPEGLVFAGPDAKFGINEKDIEKGYQRAQSLGVTNFGIHMMTGSNILEIDYFKEVVKKLLEIAGPIAKKLGITIDFIDIGGSLGVPYRPCEKELDINGVAEVVVKELEEKSHLYQLGKPLLIQEPGRYLLSDAGILLASVSSIKESDKYFIGVDSGMNTLLRPALYDAYHHILYAHDLNAAYDRSMHVVGRMCENTDVVAKDRLLPSKIQISDVLAILNTGAYGFGMSSQYNSHPRAAEVLVSNGKAYLIRDRETHESLIYNTHIPRHLL